MEAQPDQCQRSSKKVEIEAHLEAPVPSNSEKVSVPKGPLRQFDWPPQEFVTE